MKNFAFFTLLSAAAVLASNTRPVTNGRYEQKRQILGTLTSLMGKGGKVPDPPKAAPKRQEIQTDSKVPGVKRIKLRYGPYSVPNMSKGGLTGEAGSLWNYPDTAIAKPCTECTIVSQFAGLEYADGTSANIDTGMWLHHMVHFAVGPGRSDPTCYGKQSMPHFDVGTSPSNAERYFSSGNERTHVRLDRNGAATKAGFHIKSSDRFAFIIDLMNMNMEDKTVYVTMTYDIVEGPLPSGWNDVKVVWFDANQCGTSEVMPPKQSGSFTISSRPWKANFNGEIITTGGHVHDGGVEVQVNVSPNHNACTSVAGYGESPSYVFKSAMGPAMNYAKSHVSSMTACSHSELGVQKLATDQTWTITAKYDYSKYDGNKGASGRQESIMAIALMYVAIPPGGVSLRG